MNTSNSGSATSKNYVFPLVIIGALFFIFGFVTWANSQLIPYLKIACELTTTQSFLVATAFFAAYFVMALPSSSILQKTGFHKGMSLGLLIMAAGALLFIPAAGSRSYPLFLTALFIIGTGLALLQTASNPYVTVLGPLESAAKRISIMGICNKIAGIIAIYTLGSIVLKDVDPLKAKLLTLTPAEKTVELDQLASRVVQPYIIIAIVLAILAFAIFFIKLPDIEEENEGTAQTHSADKNSILQFPHLILGALTIFFYVGVEVLSYDSFAGFGEYLGYPLVQASKFATYTGYGLLAGYITGIFTIPKMLSQRKALIYNTILSLVLVTCSMVLKGMPAVICFAGLGFSNAIMWPAIWPLAMEGLGKFTKTGAALLIMGIAGGAVLPLIYGEVSKMMGSIQLGYILMIPCYLFILYFATTGYKAGKK
ncbi:MAG TPA: sugar MFS transporter [Chitinophagaceae bacterium]|jgi:FHS family L-fucose permease-like MFS transporter|nr:sugar MFS transporter [Chitinophagaceae bacterium]